MLKGNLLFGQSGGPTSVINSSASGVLLRGLETPGIDRVFAAEHGIVGILNDRLFDINYEDKDELKRLKQTPSSIFGSCRYKLAPAEVDDTDYRRVLEIFRKYNIRYFFYNGGNDTMDTCNKIANYLSDHDYPCRVVGIPKTIDNDLFGTDHCPGFGSAARFVATSVMEIKQDSVVYNYPQVTIVETMGRHAGWLAAACSLAARAGAGPDLIYVPEVAFSPERFLNDVKKVIAKKGDAFICISEGCHDAEGRFIPEIFADDNALRTDSFGHKQLGGAAVCLSEFVKSSVNIKVRAIEFSLLQRCAAHLASRTDIEEAFLAGQTAVDYALEGASGFMIGFERKPGPDYEIGLATFPLERCANAEKLLPREWINEEGNNILPPFFDYALPLIQGDPVVQRKDGLPVFANLKKVLADA